MKIQYKILAFACIVATTAALNCYICNSLQKPDCEDNYKEYLRPCPVKSFSGLKAVKPVGCRITRQYVNDESSIVRECAYTGEDVEKRSNKGSLGVSRVYSQCSTPACNSSSTLSSLVCLIMSIAAIFKLIA